MQPQPSPPVLPVVMPPPPPPSEMLVAGADESALTLEKRDASPLEVFLDTSEVLITARSGIALQHTSTSDLSTFCCKELGAGAAEFASGQALQDTDATSSKEESTTASPQTVPHNTIDGSSSAFPSSLDKFVVGATGSIHTVTQQDHDVSYLDKLLDELFYKFSDSSSKESSITAIPGTVSYNTTSGSLQSASSIGSKILIRHPPDSFKTFYIRMDRKGSFWTYPHVGGPFHSVDEADDAFERFLDELHHGGYKEQDVFSRGDRIKQEDCKYFLGGPPVDPNLPGKNTTYGEQRNLIQALVDQYNGDNNLFGDLAHELEDLVRKQMIFENHRWIYHFNFTTKQQDTDGTSNKLFFAEVSHMQGEKAWEVSCCRMINTENNDGEGHCYGCKNNGSPSMQHPNDTSAYIGGHLDRRSPFNLQCTRSDYGYDHGDDDDEDDVIDDDSDYDDDDDGKIVEKTGGRLGTWVDHILAEL